MAQTPSAVRRNVVGNRRMVGFDVTIAAASDEVEVPMKVTNFGTMSPSGSADANIGIARNSTAHATDNNDEPNNLGYHDANSSKYIGYVVGR